jgi:hypothetical protein
MNESGPCPLIQKSQAIKVIASLKLTESNSTQTSRKIIIEFDYVHVFEGTRSRTWDLKLTHEQHKDLNIELRHSRSQIIH